MKTCLHQDGYLVEVGKQPVELLRQWSTKQLRCPDCLHPIKYRHGNHVSPHFAHVEKCVYEYREPETVEHLKGKMLLVQWLKEILPQNQTFTEYYIHEIAQRADVMTIFPNGTRLCFELQCSAIPLDVLRRRMQRYRNENIKQIWILGTSSLQSIVPTRFALRTWMQEICRAQQDQLYFLDYHCQSLLIFSGVQVKQPYKTIFTCEWAKRAHIQEVATSAEGNLQLKESVILHSTSGRNRNVVPTEGHSKSSDALIMQMKNWITPTAYVNLLKKRHLEFDNHPLKRFVLSRLGEERFLQSPLFNQTMMGDYVFLLDHRLWQSFLFLTEIHHAYQRKAKYGLGKSKPTIFIKHLITSDNRFPHRPFMNIVHRYVNRALLKAKALQPMDFTEVLTIHEVIYEYLNRLATFGLLRNITPKQDSITPGGKLFGRFEILFDRFWPDQFGASEADIRRFFEIHELRYLAGNWYVKRKGKTGLP